jgi:cytochrome c oxidase subunit II
MIALTVPGFRGNQTSLNPAGPAAAHIEHTFSEIFWITASVYCLVMLVLVIAVAAVVTRSR